MAIRTSLDEIFPEVGASNLDSLVNIFENVKRTSELSTALQSTELSERDLFLGYQNLYSQSEEVQLDLKQRAVENGLDSDLLAKYVNNWQEHPDYDVFQENFQDRREFYKFSEVADQLIYMSFRHSVGCIDPELTNEGERMGPGLCIYDKPYANEYAQLALDSSDPKEFMRFGIDRGLISGADFCQSLGASFGRLYSSNEEFKDFADRSFPQRWDRPKVKEFLSTPFSIIPMMAGSYGVEMDELDIFTSEIEQYMLDTVKLYLQDQI